MEQDPTWLEPTQRNLSLRRPLGGRLRLYRPNSNLTDRLEIIRKALVRGELSPNAFNRWRLTDTRSPVTGWTFAEAGRTAEAAETEIQIARREAGNLHVVEANETTAEDTITRIVNDDKRPELLVVRRDWVQHPGACPALVQLLKTARERKLLTHLVAALDTSSNKRDLLHCQARERLQFDCNPLLRPLPRRSNIERHFGETLVAAEINPILQKAVAHYFLDFAAIGSTNGLPVRLDIEVDGRYWHEELPGQYRPSDKYRDLVLRRLGWRPIRFWTDEIEQNEAGCIERIRQEIASEIPIASRNETVEQYP